MDISCFVLIEVKTLPCNSIKSFAVSLTCLQFFFYDKFWYFLQTVTNLQTVRCAKFHNSQ